MRNDRRRWQSDPVQTLMEAPTMAELLRKDGSKQAALVIIAGMDMGEMILLDRQVTVLGRDRLCDWVIRDDGISRRHAELRRDEDGGYTVADLGSTNGVYIADQRVDHYRLQAGDKILLGRDTVLQFELLDPIDEQFRKKMYASMVRDGLTGIYNRKHFDERLLYELSFARRHGLPVSLLFFDLDHFKKINDIWGHQIGDLVLKTMSRMIEDRLRGEDVLARYGGEEFAVIARGTDLMKGVALGERLRREVETLRICIPERGFISFTISIGVATAYSETFMEAAELIARADHNLYIAKGKGRNRVEPSLGECLRLETSDTIVPLREEEP